MSRDLRIYFLVDTVNTTHAFTWDTYTIFRDDDGASCKGITEAVLHQTMNQGGGLTVTMVPGHPQYKYHNRFAPYKTEVYITEGAATFSIDTAEGSGYYQCKRYVSTNNCLWRGRIIQSEVDIDGRITFTAEGMLCYLADVPLLINGYSGEAYGDLAGTQQFGTFLKRALRYYHWNNLPQAQFYLNSPACSLTDSCIVDNEELSDMGNFYEYLQNLLSQVDGAVIRLNNQSYKLTVSVPTSASAVTIPQDKILSYHKINNVSKVVTRVYPYGYEQEDGTRLRYWDGSQYYIQSDSAIEKYGIIADNIIIDKAKNQTTLYKYGKAYLNRYSKLKSGYEVTFLNTDSMSGVYINSNLKPGNYVTLALPSGTTITDQIESMAWDLMNPLNDTITIGNSGAAASDSSVQNTFEDTYAKSIPIIKRGEYKFPSVNGSDTNSGVTTYSVTFDGEAFSSAPTVVAVIKKAFGGSSTASHFLITIYNPTTTGFQLRMYKTTTGTYTDGVWVDWIAIGS